MNPPLYFVYKKARGKQDVYTLINKILIIDDEIIICNAIKSHFTQKGYDVEICLSYQEFQEKINLGKYDLMFLDLHLKDIKGLDLLKIARNMEPSLKIIIISSYLDPGNISKAKELGAYECTSKNSQMFQVLDQIIETL